MTTYLGRSGWTHTSEPSELTNLVPAQVAGVAIHWPGTQADVFGSSPSRADTARRLEGYRQDHRNRGWDDIAYQVAVDQAGRVYRLRGEEHRSAANGDANVNRRYGAVLLLLGRIESPTPDMLGAVTDWHRDRWLPRYPDATAIRRHADLNPRSPVCPGPIVSEMIRAGQLIGGPDMSLTKQEITDIAVAVWAAGFGPADRRYTAGTMLGQTHAAVRRVEELTRAQTPEAVAEAVLARLPAEADGVITADEIKAAVVAVLVEGTGGTP